MSESTRGVYSFLADGGVQTASISTADPYAVLDDLMAVVEVLCPVMLNARL